MFRRQKWIRGLSKSIELGSEDGADWSLYIDNPPAGRESHMLTVSRCGDDVRGWIDGAPVPIVYYNAVPSIAGAPPASVVTVMVTS
jgi:hypothetical protein